MDIDELLKDCSKVPVPIDSTFAEPVEKPAQRWKNVWRAQKTGTWVCHICKKERKIEEGAIFENHCVTHPSEDIARTKAARGQTTRATYIGPIKI